MTSKPTIEVLAYAGYRGNERPQLVVLDGQRLPVVEIFDSWISTGVNPEDVVEYGYLVRCAGGYRFRLRFSEQNGWTGDIIPGPHSMRNPSEG